MNYQKHYDKLIESRLILKQERINLKKQGIYFEGHHIIPLSLGGLGKSNQYNHHNIVLLTPKEHFIAHMLLVEINPCSSNIRSFFFMCSKKYRKDFSSRLYQKARENFIKLKRNDLRGKERSEEIRNKIKISKQKNPYIYTEKHRLAVRKSHIGKKKSKDVCLRISLSQKGKKKHTQEHINNMNVPVLQYDLNMNFIQEWNSIKKAKEWLGKGDIKKALTSTKYTAGGYKWIYKND